MGYGNFAIPVLLLLCIILAVLWMLGRCQFKVIRRKKKRMPGKNIDEASLSLVTHEEHRRIDIPQVMLTKYCTCQHNLPLLNNKRKSQSEIELSEFTKNHLLDIEKNGNPTIAKMNLIRQNNLRIQRRLSKSCYFPRVFSSQKVDQQSENESNLLNITLESTLDQGTSDTSSLFENDSSDNLTNNLENAKSASTDFLLDKTRNFLSANTPSNPCTCHCIPPQIRNLENTDFSTFEKTNGFDLQIHSGIHFNFCNFSFYCCWNSNDVTAELIKYHDKLKIVDYKTALLYCSDCVICQEPFTKESAICMLQCRHIFDVKCVVRWLPHQKKCPLCWTDIGKETSVK